MADEPITVQIDQSDRVSHAKEWFTNWTKVYFLEHKIAN